MRHLKAALQLRPSLSALSKPLDPIFPGQEPPDIAPSTIGAIGELLVAADLLRKGLDVFRAVSPSCPCDFVAHHEGQLYAIEVRTLRRNKNGSFSPTKVHHAFIHVLAIIELRTETIEYCIRPRDAERLPDLHRHLSAKIVNF